MIAKLLRAWVRFLVGAHSRWADPGLATDPRVHLYFCNHTSHLDTLAIWAALPTGLRQRTRPVAAKDYWAKGGPRQYLADHALRALYIDREHGCQGGQDPLAPLKEALAAGDSLILFPEGTRGKERVPGPFKAGLFHLARQCPEVVLVPTYLDNLHRSMPKGCFVPLPLTCTVRFGEPVALIEGETKEAFLERARAALAAMAGDEQWG